MRFTKTTALLAGCGVVTASHLKMGTPALLGKRTEYDVCLNDCTLAGIPMPDKNTFGLPLESFYSEQCPPTIVGQYNAPLSQSRVCLDFSGTNLLFNFETFPGYTIKSAVVTWEVAGVVGDPPTNSPPPTTNILCSPKGDGSYLCTLPFSTILGVPSTTSIPALMAGMCPKTDREALDFYFQFSGLVEPVGGGPAIPFVQQYPCSNRNPDRSCTAWNTAYPYIEVAYRCTNCNVQPCPTSPSSTTSPSTTSSSTTSSSTTSSSTTSSSSSSTTSPPSSSSSASSTTTSSSSSTLPPPSLKTCSFGTAFGYQNPVAGQPRSFTLNTQSGQGCNRWGWYETPSVASLQGGISGPLYVGAGGNDITKAIDVGIWVATANAQGRVTVTYLLNPPYTLAEVHVNLVCLPLTKCAPGQYTYNAGAIPNLPTWSNPTPLVYPTCTGGSQAALIVHAAVNLLTVTSVCPPAKAT